MEEDSLPILLSVVNFVAAAFFLPVLHCCFFILIPCFAGCFAPVDCSPCLALGCFALDREDVVDISVHDISSVLTVLLLFVRHFFLAGLDFIGGGGFNNDASAAVGGVV